MYSKRGSAQKSGSRLDGKQMFSSSSFLLSLCQRQEERTSSIDSKGWRVAGEEMAGDFWLLKQWRAYISENHASISPELMAVRLKETAGCGSGGEGGLQNRWAAVLKRFWQF